MRKIVILALAMTGSAAALAEAPAPAGPDPNEVICRNVNVIGSRLARQRRCATRAQWANDARIQRESIQLGQTTQVNPQDMNARERAIAAGRYVGGLTPPPLQPRLSPIRTIG